MYYLLVFNLFIIGITHGDYVTKVIKTWSFEHVGLTKEFTSSDSSVKFD